METRLGLFTEHGYHIRALNRFYITGTHFISYIGHLQPTTFILTACVYFNNLMLQDFILIVFISDLEWKIIYVGAAESEEYDQTLETILVGPVPGGRHKFVFQVDYFFIVHLTLYHTIST